MRDRHVRTAPLALALLAAAATAACATPDSPARPRTESEPPVAREVLVRTKVDASGAVVITPDPAIVRAGQKLVFDSCCESLKITWKTRVAGIPEPRCEGGECTLVAPRVNERTEVFYDVSGKCGGREFHVDPRLIFTR
ncbi:MAG: hypothetical protein KJ062_05180 [Thermoanaerobaculia bacterium]|nr:hypothetical protein [Thermoanaerobaculia bacterium]